MNLYLSLSDQQANLSLIFHKKLTKVYLLISRLAVVQYSYYKYSMCITTNKKRERQATCQVTACSAAVMLQYEMGRRG